MKTIFWNVDTQYDFMRDDEDHKGTLAVPDASGIEEKLKRLTAYAEEHGIVVVNTADWHTEDSAELSDKPDFVTTFPRHCMIGTKGAEYVPATKPSDAYVIDWRDASIDEGRVVAARNIILYKDDFDIFKGSPHTDGVLGILKPDRAIVYGVATNVCVDRVVHGLLDRGIDVYVPLDAIKELPGLPLDEVLQGWVVKGANLITTAALQNYT